MDIYNCAPQQQLEMGGSHYYDLLKEAHLTRMALLAGGKPTPWRSVVADWFYNVAFRFDSQVQYRNRRVTA